MKNYLLQQAENAESDYIPQLYVKIKGWYPPPASLTIENKITEFEKKLKEEILIQQKKKYNIYNLAIPQCTKLSFLNQHQEFIILPTDKNLGPVILNREDYIKNIKWTSPHLRLIPESQKLKTTC